MILQIVRCWLHIANLRWNAQRFSATWGFHGKNEHDEVFGTICFKAMLLWQWNYPEGHLLWKPHIFHLAGLSESFATIIEKQNQNNFQNWPQPRCQPSQATERGRLALFVAMVQVSKMRRTSGRGLARHRFRWLAGCWPAFACSGLSWSFAAAPYTREGTAFSPAKSLNFQRSFLEDTESRHICRPTTWIPLVLHRCCCRMLQDSSVRWRKWQPALAWNRFASWLAGSTGCSSYSSRGGSATTKPSRWSLHRQGLAETFSKSCANAGGFNTSLFMFTLCIWGRFPILLRILNWAENTN